jgi:hypothetical protein
MSRTYSDGRDRPSSKMIARLDVLHARAQIQASMDLVSEIEARLRDVSNTPMRSLTHEECETEDGQIAALNVKVHRPMVEREALTQYRRIVQGMEMEYADEEMEASLHLEDLTAE